MGSAGVRESLGRQVATVAPFQYALTEEVAHLNQVEPGVERHLRLDLRVLLNQNNGTWGTTNAIADDLAKILLRDFDIRERGGDKPDPMTDPKGTLYIAPSGDVYRHDGLSPEWLAREGHPVHANFKVMLLDRGFSTRDELPEGSYIVWRPTDG